MLRGDARYRLDAQFYTLKFDFTNCINLKSIVKVKGGKRIPKGLNYANYETDFLYLRVENIKSNYIDFASIKYISESIYSILKRYEINNEEVIISNAGTIGKIALFKNKTIKPVILTENCAKLVIFDKNKIIPEFLAYILSTHFVQEQMRLEFVQTTIPKLGLERIANLRIPKLPVFESQQKIVTILKSVNENKNTKIKKSKELLNSFEDLLFKTLSIKLPLIKFTKKIIIELKKLENALNVERYAISYDNTTLKWSTIEEVGKVKLTTITPSSDFYKNTHFTLMRIDDLPNKPQKSEVREVKGRQIAGSVQKVKENDVLIARLEPTILNKKIVSVLSSENTIVASSEFIRLTCNDNFNPLFVKYMLQTDFYTKLMISKTRGATPSRRRLSRDDFEKLPFPIIDKSIQDKIAIEFKNRINKAIDLKEKAINDFKKAKNEIEKMIIK